MRRKRVQLGFAGVAMIALGAWTLDDAFLVQLRRAELRQTVALSGEELVAAPGLVAAGLALIAVALIPRFWNRELHENLVPLMLLVATVGTAFGSGYFVRLWLKEHLRALGYDF